MDFLNTAFLALVQGVTEFLPISSSAHLILGRHLLEALGFAVAAMTPEEELALDIALHVGSLGAVILYFWRDIVLLLGGLLDMVTGRGGSRARLLLVHSSKPIVEIALACGFSSASHFAKAYRDAYGISPQALRKSERQAAAREQDEVSRPARRAGDS